MDFIEFGEKKHNFNICSIFFPLSVFLQLDSVTCVFPLFICERDFRIENEKHLNSPLFYPLADKEYLHKTRNGTVILHNVETGQSSDFVSSDKFAQVDASDYYVSADRKFVCFESNYTKLWRHSYTASYSIYDVENSKFVTPSHIPQEVQYLVWAPTRNMLAYVWDFNVYIKPEATSPSVQVTTNGKKNAILNGIPDWVYEEEMFSSHGAMWWSPNGTFLAYAEFNDTQVQNIEFSWYGTGQYPETVVIPYPKVGSFTLLGHIWLFFSSTMIGMVSMCSDHYLSSVTWITDSRVAVQWLMRIQNHVILQIYHFDGSNWNPSQVSVPVILSLGGLHFSPLPPFFVEDSNNFYQVMSDKNKYKHIHYVTIEGANPITTGTWEVIYITKLTKDAIYFVSNEHGLKAGQRNLYNVQSPRQCLTCDLNVDRCQYNSGYFSLNASYYRWDCYGPGLPLFTLRDNRGPGSEIHVLEDNKVLEEMLRDKNLPTTKRDKIKLLRYVSLIPCCAAVCCKYGYAGPCSQKVDYRFRLNWATYLASAENIIVASIDGRGSGYQGDKLMHSIYKRLGTYEVEDQIETTRKFIDMGFIDKEKIAIWGWSYGGYVTSMVLGAGSGVFKCGMAVAPVSKWEYYGTYLPEIFRNPPFLPFLLRNSTVTSRAKNFKSVKYLLVHGTADDNVHFQQAAEISEALVEEQVDFEAMWYTDKDHGLDGAAHRHVYTHLSHFLLNCFENSSP
uniref:Dipeptidyl peptidase 4-like n=1 Tax=Scleropages formosus TaxID=113540 RepID=A0A8C9TS08_SCLFO